MKVSHPKIGLALGSGGARGFAHIGVLQALEANGIPVHMIAGSSIGALIGAHYAAFKDTLSLEKFALSFNRRRGFALFDPTVKGGLLKGVKIERLIADMLKNASFQSLHVPFAAIATDYITAEPVILQRGDMIKAIRASISVPGIFQPVTLEKRLLADGGLSNPVPVEVVRAMGAEIVIAVNLDTHYFDEDTPVLPSLSHVPLHSVRILRHHLAIYAAKSAEIIIAPRVSQIGLIGWNYFFDTKKAQTIIAEGRRAAEDVMPAIRKAIVKTTHHSHPSFIGLLLRKAMKSMRKDTK